MATALPDRVITMSTTPLDQPSCGASPSSRSTRRPTTLRETQVDFGELELGFMFDPESGRRRKVWALVFTAAYSRHCYTRLSFSQTLEVVIAGFDAAWAFFGGVFKIVIPEFGANPKINGRCRAIPCRHLTRHILTQL